MFIKNLKPVTPTLRYKTKLIKPKIMLKSKKMLIRLSNGGRNMSGKLVCRSKGPRSKFFTPTHTTMDFRKYDVAVLSLNMNPRTRNYYNVYKTIFGIVFTLPAIQGNTVGSFIKKGRMSLPSYGHVELGVACFAKYVPFFTSISNLFYPEKNKFAFSTSSGTFSVKLKAEKKEKLLKIKLPSEKIKFFKQFVGCLVGSNYQNEKHKFNPGKAGFSALNGVRPAVRGVAKNPVDHPNGGRTKSCKPELSPWGWVAKRNK